MNKTYIVRLTDDERQELIQLTKSGKAAAYKIKHAHILLHVDANGLHWSDEHVATALHCHGNTVHNVRQRFVEQGLAAALVRTKQAKPSGPYSDLPTNSSRSTWWRLSRMKRFDRR